MIYIAMYINFIYIIMSKNIMKPSTYVKPSSDSGESDSDQDTLASNTKKTKPKKGFFVKQSESDSDSDNEIDQDSDTEICIGLSCTSNPSTPYESINPNGENGSESGINNADLDTEFDTKSNTESEINKLDTNKTRKALKNAIRIQEQKIKMEEKKRLKAINSKNDNSDSDSDEKCHSFALDSLQQHNHMMAESIFSKIHIRCVQRNSRKSTTTIEGICGSFFQDNEKIKKMLKALSRGTRATHKFDKETNSNIIEISGNKIVNMIDVLCEHVECEKSQIVVHGVLA